LEGAGHFGITAPTTPEGYRPFWHITVPTGMDGNFSFLIKIIYNFYQNYFY